MRLAQLCRISLGRRQKTVKCYGILLPLKTHWGEVRFVCPAGGWRPSRTRAGGEAVPAGSAPLEATMCGLQPPGPARGGRAAGGQHVHRPRSRQQEPGRGPEPSRSPQHRAPGLRQQEVVGSALKEKGTGVAIIEYVSDAEIFVLRLCGDTSSVLDQICHRKGPSAISP